PWSWSSSVPAGADWDLDGPLRFVQLGTPTQILEPERIQEIQWSPDGHAFLYARRRADVEDTFPADCELFYVELDSSGAIVDVPVQVAERARAPGWTSDGTAILSRDPVSNALVRWDRASRRASVIASYPDRSSFSYEKSPEGSLLLIKLPE